MSGDVTNRTTQGTLRTFIAIDLPTPILDALANTQVRVQAFLRDQGIPKTLRWSPVKNLHLTLRFLGDTTPRQVKQVTERLQQIAAEVTPFTLCVDSSAKALGGFPNLRQPRVLWSGVEGDLDALRRVQAQIEAAIQAEGFAPEEKAFSPHLTLARASRDADRRALTQVGQAIGEFAKLSTGAEALSFQVNYLVFYRSELAAGGSRYTPLAKVPFRP